MENLFTIYMVIYVLFLVFMGSPFGFYWISKNLDEGKPCYGIIIAFAGALPAKLILIYFETIIK
jgi:hypothetical protein